MTALFLFLFGALIISFMCSILESVLLSTPMSYVTMREQEGSKGAKLLKEYKSHIDKPISGILSLNTIANTIGAAGVGATAVHLWGETYLGVASGTLTLLILVFSEIIPKTIGASYWRKIAIPCAKIIRVLVWIMYPLVLLAEGLTRMLTPKEAQKSVSREEVSAMVSVALEEGVFKTQEDKIIQNTIKLSNIPAEQIMTPGVVVERVPESMTVKEFLRDCPLTFSRIPVYETDRDFITGFVLKSEILEKLAEDKFDTHLGDLRRHIISFTEEDSVFNIWDKMLAKKEHISMIVDDYGCFRGLVTMEDVIETMIGEEIVDEADTTPDLQELAREKYRERMSEEESEEDQEDTSAKEATASAKKPE